MSVTDFYKCQHCKQDRFKVIDGPTGSELRLLCVNCNAVNGYTFDIKAFTLDVKLVKAQND